MCLLSAHILRMLGFLAGLEMQQDQRWLIILPQNFPLAVFSYSILKNLSTHLPSLQGDVEIISPCFAYLGNILSCPMFWRRCSWWDRLERRIFLQDSRDSTGEEKALWEYLERGSAQRKGCLHPKRDRGESTTLFFLSFFHEYDRWPLTEKKWN